MNDTSSYVLMIKQKQSKAQLNRVHIYGDSYCTADEIAKIKPHDIFTRTLILSSFSSNTQVFPPGHNLIAYHTYLPTAAGHNTKLRCTSHLRGN